MNKEIDDYSYYNQGTGINLDAVKEDGYFGSEIFAPPSPYLNYQLNGDYQNKKYIGKLAPYKYMPKSTMNDQLQNNPDNADFLNGVAAFMNSDTDLICNNFTYAPFTFLPIS